MLRSLADEHLDWRRLGIFGRTLLDDSLNRVAQQFANDVLEVAEDVWEGGIKMAVNLDLWDLNLGTICASDQFLRSFPAVVYDFFCIAPQEDLADRLLIVQQLGVGEVPWRIESLGECQMLLRNDAS